MRLGVYFRTWAVVRLLIARTASASPDCAVTWAWRLNSSCWRLNTTCSIFVDIALLQIELLLRFATQLPAITVQQTSRSTKLVQSWALLANFHHAITNRATILGTLRSQGADDHHERQPSLRYHDELKWLCVICRGSCFLIHPRSVRIQWG